MRDGPARFGWIFFGLLLLKKKGFYINQTGLRKQEEKKILKKYQDSGIKKKKGMDFHRDKKNTHGHNFQGIRAVFLQFQFKQFIHSTSITVENNCVSVSILFTFFFFNFYNFLILLIFFISNHSKRQSKNNRGHLFSFFFH